MALFSRRSIGNSEFHGCVWRNRVLMENTLVYEGCLLMVRNHRIFDLWWNIVCRLDGSRRILRAFLLWS